MTRMKQTTEPEALGLDAGTAMPRANRGGDGYPPYDIERIRGGDTAGTDRLRLTLAVAGFGAEELEVLIQGGQLLIRGRQGEKPGADYLFQGIAARQFQRTFSLEEGIDVLAAKLRNGLLVIDLVRPLPKPEVRKINISAS